jgi:hypothetical protein
MALNQSARHRPCRWDARKIALCVALTGIIAAATPSQSQTPPDQPPATSETPTPTPAPSPTPENADVHAAGNTIASGDKPAPAGQAVTNASVDLEEHFIEVPSVAGSRRSAAQAVGAGLAELKTPFLDCFIADNT